LEWKIGDNIGFGPMQAWVFSDVPCDFLLVILQSISDEPEGDTGNRVVKKQDSGTSYWGCILALESFSCMILGRELYLSLMRIRMSRTM
jgi:hypothetical protein